MHTSLASIGRACTIQEDEDPPATSLESSFDMQQVDYIEQSLRSCTTSVDELVTLALSLCHSIKILPNFNKIVLQEHPCGIKQSDSILNTDKYDNNKNQPSSALDEHINSSTINDPIICVHTSSNTSRNKADDLNHLTYLHRFYLKLLNVVHLDTLNNTVKELSLGLLALLAHSETVLIKETNLLDCILSKFSISSNNIYSFQALYEKNSCNILNDYHEFLLTTLLHFNDESGDDDIDDNSNDTPITGYTTTHYDYSSQLGELRILCESLRQCWTQMKRLANEQRNMQYRLNQINASNNCDTILTKIFLDAYRINSMYSKLLTLAIINSAQYLIYSGVSLLGYMELSRFTHDELWEMTRGIEELNILRGHLHNTFQIYRNTHLYKLICNDENIFHSAQILSPTTDTTSISSTFKPLSQLISYNLLNDPVDVVFSMSVGCLFSLFAKQRSLRLAHLIYLHIYKFPKLFFSEPDNNHTTIDYNHNLSNKNLLQQEFQKFIQDNHGLLASDYLRNEYEFISNFLDILSQSTDLLYQVQKLQLVYTSAAATAQIRQVEAEQRLKTFSNTNNLDPCSISSPTSLPSSSISHAVSVEGKHGVLVRATSTNHPNMTETKEIISKTPRKTDIHHRTNILPNYISRYQDALHRSSTLDRYVATGSAVSPYSSISNHTLGTDFTKLQSDNQTKPDDHNYKKDKNDSTIYTATESSSITSDKEKEQSKHRVNSKKGVQWSDHREVSTRHQIIGRYLEMTWKYSENTLTSLFLSTSSTIIKQRNGNSNNITVNEPKLCKSTLTMPSVELLRLGNNICQLTITSDFFPTGLLPVLRKQALKCKEYAIWRNWYEEHQMFECILKKNDENTISVTGDNYNLQDTSEITFSNNVVSHETCDHLNHNSLYSIYNIYVQKNTVNTSDTQSSFCPCNIDKCQNCCITMNLQRLWGSKAFLIITDINSSIELITYMTKLFVNDEQTWMNILSLIQNEIKASGISSIVHHFDISIPDSYKSLLLKLYKAYEFTRRLDVIFIRFLIMLKNICFNEYNKCMKNWNVTLQQTDDNHSIQHQTNIIDNNINQITYYYQQSIYIELLFIHYENLIKCFKNLTDIVFNNIIYCILYWFGYTNNYVNDEILKEFKQLFNPMNSYFLSNLTSTPSSRISVGTTTTISNSNFDDLIEIKTNLLNVDRNVLIRLARVIGTLSQVNNLLISLDKNIKEWKETLRKTFPQIMNKLIDKYILNYHNEILCNFQIENNDLINLMTIFLKSINKTIGTCFNSPTERIISIENSSILCEYHHNVFYYIIQPTVIQFFHRLSLLLKETSINYDEFIQKYLIIRFQNQVPLNLLQEIYQSIKIHNQSGESSLKCFHSTMFTEHQPDNVIQEQETEKFSSLSSLLTDTKQLKSKLNSGSAGVDFIQSTMIFMSTAMKNTVNKHLPKEPKDKIASFAADVCSNLRLPFRSQTTNNLNNCSKTTSTTTTTTTTTTITIAKSSTMKDKKESLNEYSMENQ